MSPTPVFSASITAQPPFDQPSADITLRTCDHVDFHVHSQILAQASPVFATMFNLPQPKTPAAAPEAQESRPVVDVAEDSTALDALLRFCYPVRSPALGSAEAIEPVLKAALKYDMEWVTELLTDRLLAVASSSPLRVWAIGCRTKLEEVARKGAEALLHSLPEGDKAELRVLPGISRASTDLEGVSSADYLRCLSYIAKRRAGASPGAELPFLLRYSRTQEERSSADIIAALMAELPFHYIPALDPGSSLPSPDIICMSSEGVILRAHRSILSLHSPVFRRRIKRVTATASKSQTMPIIRIKTPADVMHYLLTLCYGGDGDCLPHNMDILTSLLHTARTYQMDRITPAIESRWSSAARLYPVRAFLRAEIAGLKGCAKVAARIMVDAEARPHMWHGALFDRVPAHDYHRLLVYHESCQTAMREELRRAKTRWEEILLDGQPKALNRPGSMRVPTQVSDYIKQLETKLMVTPAAYRDCASEIMKHSSKAFSNPLHYQSGKVASALYDFASTLPRKIEEAIDRVEWKY